MPTWFDISFADNSIQCNTIQCNTVQCNTVQCSTMEYNTIRYNTIPIRYNTIQWNTMQYNKIQYNTRRYNTIECVSSSRTRCTPISLEREEELIERGFSEAGTKSYLRGSKLLYALPRRSDCFQDRQGDRKQQR